MKPCESGDLLRLRCKGKASLFVMDGSIQAFVIVPPGTRFLSSLSEAFCGVHGLTAKYHWLQMSENDLVILEETDESMSVSDLPHDAAYIIGDVPASALIRAYMESGEPAPADAKPSLAA